MNARNLFTFVLGAGAVAAAVAWLSTPNAESQLDVPTPSSGTIPSPRFVHAADIDLAGSDDAAFGRSLAPDQQRTLRGTLELPSAAPLDDSLAIVALSVEESPGDRTWSERSWDRDEVLARANVDEHGQFELELPHWRSTVLLDVDGRYLYLDEPEEVHNLTRLREPLRPQLGGAIEGRLLLPSSQAAVPHKTRVGAYGSHFSGAGMTRSLDLTDAVTFELRGLAADLSYQLWANADIYPGSLSDDEFVVRAGELVRTELQLHAGATVRGRVVDADGEGVAGVEITGDAGASYSIPKDAGRTRTDELGHFELRGLEARMQRLIVLADNYLKTETADFDLVDGQTIDDVRIVLESGETIRGTIRWPAGEPAAGVAVHVVPLDPAGSQWHLIERARSSEGSTRTAADGSFHVGGLPSGNYGIYAWTEREAQPWSARAASIATGTSDLTLELAAPIVFSAQVRDDAGQPVPNFSIVARRADWPAWMDGPSREIDQAFEQTAGEFTLTSLDAGKWDLYAHASGHIASHTRSVQVPGNTEPFVLERTARIRGTVLDPTGQPIAGAEVRADVQGSGGRSDSATTAEDGRFELESAGPGALALRATSPEWAPSAEIFVQTEAGEELDQTLTLSVGGDLTGIVFDASGAAEPDCLVIAQSEMGEMREVRTDAAGRFVMSHLAPGPYQIIATPKDDAWQQANGDDGPTVGDMVQELRMAVALVTTGEVAEVELGAPARAPVVVRGRVHSQGSAVVRASVMAMAENREMLANMRGATTDAGGAFEFTLAQPGNYTFIVLADDLETDFPCTIPAADEFALELELPRGSIAGHLRLPDGSAPDGGALWIRRTDGTSELAAFMRTSLIAVESDGSFLIEGLHPGTYALTATVEEMGVVTEHGVRVHPDARTKDVELLMRPEGRLTGVVHDAAGQPVIDAAVVVRDHEGRRCFKLHTLPDHEGRFELRKVPVGEHLVSAYSDTQRSPQVQVRVEAETELSSPLRLRNAARISVRIEDADGNLARGILSVTNELGHEFVGLATQDEIEELFTQTAAAEGRRVGPLEAGRYVIRVTDASGARREQTVRLNGGEERAITLELPAED